MRAENMTHAKDFAFYVIPSVTQGSAVAAEISSEVEVSKLLQLFC